MAPSNFSIMFAVSIREGGKTEKNSFKEKQNGIIFRLTECIIFRLFKFESWEKTWKQYDLAVKSSCREPLKCLVVWFVSVASVLKRPRLEWALALLSYLKKLKKKFCMRKTEEKKSLCKIQVEIYGRWNFYHLNAFHGTCPTDNQQHAEYFKAEFRLCMLVNAI